MAFNDIMGSHAIETRLPGGGMRPPASQEGAKQGDDADAKAKRVFNKYREAKAFKKNYDKDWDRYYKLYIAQHWLGNRPEWKSTPTVNFIFATIETIIPIMTDSNPTITIVPRMPDDAGIADVLGNVVKKIWTDQGMQLKLPTILKNSLIFGS